MREETEKGRALRDVYRDTVDHMRPLFGHWAIFDHCMPFNVSRAHDEATGTAHPRIWTAERDLEMWRALEGDTPVKSAEARP